MDLEGVLIDRTANAHNYQGHIQITFENLSPVFTSTGASPLVTALFYDESTVKALNTIGSDF